MSLAYLRKENVKKSKKKKKKEIRYYRKIKSFYLSNNLRIFNEIFRKNLPDDNIDNIIRALLPL